MPRYIDADKLENDGWSASRTYQQDAKTMVYETHKMTDFPTADVVEKDRYDRLLENSTIISDALIKYQSADMVEVVRCKDCKYYLHSNEKCALIDTRLNFYETNKTWTDDEFCSWAERREDG